MINALGQNAKISDPAVMQKALDAIAYQGQAGSFEAADMARWFPELLAGMGKIGITGMDAVTQLGSMLQVQMKTAGGADEAANNLKNWMEKIGSGDTVKAYKDAGIDYQASMNTGLQNGKSTLESSFELAQKYIAATDPKKAAAMAAATAKISKETDPEKAKAMIASLEQALRTGDLFADMQVKGALTAYMQNKELYAQLKKDSASATGILDKNPEERRQASAQKWAEMAQGMDEAMRAIGDACLDGARLRYSPGNGWCYSNVGYMLVGRLIERLTDLKLDEAVIQRTLSPLGLSSLRFAKTQADLQTTHLGSASNYDPAWVYHGVLIGHISQAALFLDRLFCADLLSTDLLHEMQTARTLGGPIPRRPWITPGYGLGVMQGTIDGGYSLCGHTGCGPGSVIAVYRICVGNASACCAAFEAGASEGAVEAIVVGQLMQVLRQRG